MTMFSASGPSAPPIDALRAAARERVAGTPLPTTESEVWRYSRIGDLDPDRFDAAVVAERQVDGLATAAGSDAAVMVVLDNGRVTEIRGQARGVTVSRLAERPDAAAILNRVMVDATDVFADANTAYAPDPIVVEIAAGAVIERPVVIDHVVSRPGRRRLPPHRRARRRGQRGVRRRGPHLRRGRHGHLGAGGRARPRARPPASRT